jgi:serine-type D-Ala-D-Ala carboxypeptidase/endopeptidase (penicillin-binding protein 4)
VTDKPSGRSRRSVLGLLATAPFAAGGLLSAPGIAQAASNGRTVTSAHRPALEARIREIMGRPVFSGAVWAMRYQEVGAAEPIYALSSDRPMQPASAAKVFISGTAHEMLGPDHRFHTRVYRTGPIVGGVLRGDLVLVAGADLLLGGRIQPDGSLWLKAEDHSYGGDDSIPVPGDPIQSLRDLADQVAACGVRRIEGRVLVDASLFRHGEEQGGTGVVPISPMMLNDNIVDVVAKPGRSVGDPAVLRITPRFGYVDIVNEVTTVAPEETALPLRFVDDVENPDGTRTVRLTGSVPLLEGFDTLRPYYVPGPVRFAELAFVEALRGKGIRATSESTAGVDPKALAAHHTPGKLVAELVSPPLSESVKVMLKLSSNPHTAHWPYIVGAIAGHEHDNPESAYQTMRSALLEQAGLDPHPPGSENGLYSPDFFVQFLTHMTRKPYLPQYHQGLPIMGVDGTLAKVQVDSPAAGHVHAKTGGALLPDGNARALTGYIDLPRGRRVAFGSFIEKKVATPEEGQALQPIAMEALGEIATAVYLEETS